MAKPTKVDVFNRGLGVFLKWGPAQMVNLRDRIAKAAPGLTGREVGNAGARPRRIAIAPDDRVYYGDYARGYLGRLDPTTGKVDEWPSPGGPRSQPYGIAATLDGMIWYSESNVQPNTIVRFDPKTNQFQTAPVPSGGGVLRHIVTSIDGKDLLIASSGVDKVGIVRIGR